MADSRRLYADNERFLSNFCGNKTEYDAFWSEKITVNTSNPDLTRCFQETVMVWVPAALMLTAGSVMIGWYHSQPKQFGWSDKSALNIAKLTLAAVCWFIAFLQCGYYVEERIKDTTISLSSLLGSFVQLLGLSLAIYLIHLEYKTGWHTSGLQLLYWTIQLVTGIVKVRSFSMQTAAGEETLPFIDVTVRISLSCLCVIWMLVFIADKPVLRSRSKSSLSNSSDENTPLIAAESTKKTVTNCQKASVSAPQTYCSYISDITYFWFTKPVIRGWKRSVVFEDLPDLLESDKCKSLVARFKCFWKRECQKQHNVTCNQKTILSSAKVSYKEKNGPSLTKALLLTIVKPFVLCNFLRLITIASGFFNPLLLRALLSFIDSRDPYTWKGIFIALAMYLSSCVHYLLLTRCIYYGYNAGMNLRTVVTAAIYRKSLRLSSAAKKQTTVGEIINMISVDAQKLQELPIYGTVLFATPLTIVIGTVFIWHIVGPSALAGLALLAVIIPFNGVWIANRTRKLQEIQMKAKDERVRTLNEVLSGIRVLKLYAWEKSFEEKIKRSREEELKTIRYINILNAIGGVVWNNAAYLMCIAIFSTYVLSSSNNILNPDKVFVTFALVNMISFGLHLLPISVSYAGQAIVSIRRISKFLLLEDVEENSVVYDSCSEKAVSIKEATFSWTTHDLPSLKRINLEVEKDELVAVVGQVGSGKSSLILAMLGEMITISGTVTMRESVSYVPQEAWIQNNTIRQNILFNKVISENKYQCILNACALVPDLKLLPDGDQTQIGEKGINLSGGQKQRISLARAVCQDSNIYLLDDTLSAVDAHVAKHLFKRVLGPKGLLRHKTRILVTHSVTYLPQMDRIIVMKDGKISESGTYEQLLENKGAFAEFLIKQPDNNPGSITKDTDQIYEVERLPLHPVPNESLMSDISRSLHSKSSSISTTSSVASRCRESAEKMKQPFELIKEEKEAIGNINIGVIGSYVKAGGLLYGAVVMLFHIIFLVFLICGQVWLSEWSADANAPEVLTEQMRDLRLGVYGGLLGGQVLSILIGCVALAESNTNATRVFHSGIVKRLLRAPLSFFDTTPLGRIMNRCSKDIDYLDTNIPFMVTTFVYSINPLIAVVAIVSYSTPIFLTVVIPMAFAIFALHNLYIGTARQLRRIESAKRSPIFAHFDESVTGASSIRAFGRVQDFIDKCDELTDENQRVFYYVNVCTRWLECALVFFGALVTFFAALFAILARFSIGSSAAGLSVSFAIMVSLYMSFLVRAATELETYMVAAERVKEYSEVPTEAAYEQEYPKTNETWPQKGAVTYINYSSRYRPGLDLVLKNVSIDIKPAEKIGIVGRTGAGKSSMALALFRIIEAAGGSICIDSIKINDLGLYNLRSKLTIIPQDPVVFSGSLRFNIDPQNVRSDHDLWNALQLAHLKPFVESLGEGLDYECGGNGDSLSVGQKQLVCLARALLRKSKILVLDEATSGVDLQTDELIQETIRSVFQQCTVITIAHRINTILDCDRVMVLDNGRIQECGPPNDLLRNQSSIFSALAKDAGITILS